MRLHILSDLHLEFGSAELPPTDADLVILAGDIHLGREGWQWAWEEFPSRPVVYVLGNHEFLSSRDSEVNGFNPQIGR